jgi:glycosyltransferase involved in cell wall biosynthesis
LQSEQPEIILFICPVASLGYWEAGLAQAVRAGCIPIAHVVADGLPVSPQEAKSLKQMRAVLAGTNALANHLQQTHGIASTVVPNGVDLSIFHPLEANQRHSLRVAVGVDRQFLIGVFGRNDERKQQPRILEALRLLRSTYGFDDIQLYLHCQPVDRIRGWDLAAVARQLGVEPYVIFPKSFYQLSGVPRTRLNDGGVSTAPTSIDELTYCERLAVCDVIVNAAFVGGFELGTLEAQATGVPLAVTNDYGNMAEVAGNAAILMEGASGIWLTGARQYLVDPDTIARHILRARRDDCYVAGLVRAGLQRAPQWTWDASGQLLHDSLVSILSQQSTHRYGSLPAGAASDVGLHEASSDRAKTASR